MYSLIFPPFNLPHLLSNGLGNSIMTAKKGGINLVFLALSFVTSDRRESHLTSLSLCDLSSPVEMVEPGWRSSEFTSLLRALPSGFAQEKWPQALPGYQRDTTLNSTPAQMQIFFLAPLQALQRHRFSIKANMQPASWIHAQRDVHLILMLSSLKIRFCYSISNSTQVPQRQSGNPFLFSMVHLLKPFWRQQLSCPWSFIQYPASFHGSLFSGAWLVMMVIS